jgi:hypothetical protein
LHSRWTRSVLSVFSPLALLLGHVGAAHALTPGSSGCENIPHADHPSAKLSSGDGSAVVFLPDTEHGYYRSTRFDWSGVVGCYAYKGHTFWGEWFPKYDPMLNDAITGPVEEFRSQDGGIGYADAKPGELFVKIGVGTLRKVDDSAYKFGFFFPLVDTGKWSVHAGKTSVRFQQTLHSPTGIAYVYTKTLRLGKQGDVVSLEHTLKNVGKKTITTDVYDHDFFMLDGKPTGPGMTVRWPFAPKLDAQLDPALAKVDGDKVEYVGELQPHQTVAAYVTGYSDKVSDYDITVEDASSGIGVRQTSDSPIAKFYLWSIRTTISPEAYIHLDVAPGKSQSWKIDYHFFAK